jgi:S1-C subfamily serine protease
MRRIVAFGPGVVVLLAAAVVLFAAPAAVLRVGAASTGARVRLAHAVVDDEDLLERLNRAVRAVADSILPSIVHISTGGPGPVGAGWVYDAEGHIITNAHVVRGLDGVIVQFSDGRAERAAVLGADVFTDVAVLRVRTRSGLFPARRETGHEPQVGDRVFAFGSPFGFKFSMSEGIVSGLARDPAAVVEPGGLTSFIQTDAAVNPGNSGGPLVDVKGRVIGMNVAIATARDGRGATDGNAGSVGISFAIPLATIESVADQLIRHGEVRRGFLGVSLDPRRPGRAEREGEFLGVGVTVAEVTPGAPADVAGLRPGDIILAVGGSLVSDVPSLRAIVTRHRPSEEIPVRVWREGEVREFVVSLGEYPRAVLVVDPVLFRLMSVGAVAREMTGGGVVVEVVGPDSLAWSWGLRTGQEIVEVAGRPTRGLEEVALALADAGFLEGRTVRIAVRERDADGEWVRRELRVRVP